MSPNRPQRYDISLENANIFVKICGFRPFPTFPDLFRPSFRLSGAGFTRAVSPRRRDGRSAQRGTREGASRANREHAAKRSEGEHARESEEATERGTQQARGPGYGRHGGGGRGNPPPHHSTNALGAHCVVFSREAVGGIPLPYYFTAGATEGSGAPPSEVQAQGFTNVHTAEHGAYTCGNFVHIRMAKGGRSKGRGSTQRRRRPDPRAAHERQRSGTPEAFHRDEAERRPKGVSGAKRGGTEGAADRPQPQKGRPNEAEERLR